MNRPPQSLENFVARLIPPACREEVLGDLCESYRSPLQYALLAARTIPFVILSRARRSSNPLLVLTRALLIYGGFAIDAWHSQQLARPGACLRLAAPAALALLWVLLCEAFEPARYFVPVTVILMILTMDYTGWSSGFVDSMILLFAGEMILESWRVSGLRRLAFRVAAACLVMIVLFQLDRVLNWGVFLLIAFGFSRLRHRGAGSNSRPGPA